MTPKEEKLQLMARAFEKVYMEPLDLGLVAEHLTARLLEHKKRFIKGQFDLMSTKEIIDWTKFIEHSYEVSNSGGVSPGGAAELLGELPEELQKNGSSSTGNGSNDKRSKNVAKA